jgi:hypothetical protein
MSARRSACRAPGLQTLAPDIRGAEYFAGGDQGIEERLLLHSGKARSSKPTLYRSSMVTLGANPHARESTSNV